MMIGSILLSLMMTFTVETKSSVKAEGTWPYDMSATYSCTYQKGTVRAGDLATLQITGLEDIQIESVKLYLRSNKEDGAGKIAITADDQLIYQKSGTYKDWFGAYNNTDFQPIGWTGQRKLVDGRLQVQLMGTTNSLYIEKFIITYSQTPQVAHAVTLVDDHETTTLSESEPGSGIILPECGDRDEWFFLGWTTSEISTPTTDLPDLFQAGKRYFPAKDLTLWAVWTDEPQLDFERQSQPVSGYYILEEFNYRLTCDVENGLIPLRSNTESIYDVDIYHLLFDTDAGTCLIRNYATGRYVGFDLNKNQLSTEASSWHYRILPDNTWLFLAKEEANKVWILFQKNEEETAWLHDYYLGDNPQNIWSLYRVPEPAHTPYYWSHPWPLDVPRTLSDDQERIIRFGIYEIRINGNKKSLHLLK